MIGKREEAAGTARRPLRPDGQTLKTLVKRIRALDREQTVAKSTGGPRQCGRIDVIGLKAGTGISKLAKRIPELLGPSR